jgi:hypothetical protein
MRIRVLGLVLVVLAGSFGAAAGQSPGNSSDSAWRSARYHGGSDYEFAERLAVDARGDAYLLGRTFSQDMDAAVIPTASSRGEQASATFVLKLGRDGLPIYAAPVGQGFAFMPLDIAVGMDGAAHVLAREGDVYHVLRIDPDGAGNAYHVTFDGRARDPLFPSAIGVDDAGHTVLAGWSWSGLFVARLDARGSVFDMAPIPVNAELRDMAVDPAGDVYLTGSIAAEGLPATAGRLQPRYNGGTCFDVFPPVSGPPQSFPCPDAFLLKVTRRGEIAYATYFGGTGWDQGATVAVDRTGAAVVAGLTRSTDLPTVRAAQAQCNPGFAPLVCGDAFIAKVDPAGTALVFATYLGGMDTEGVNGLAVDAAGSTFIAGSITGSGIPVYRALQSANGGGGSDGFVTALGPSGNLMWSTYVGGPNEERVVGVGAAGGMIYIGGETTSPGWALGGPAHHGARDLFSARVLVP